MIRFNNVSKTLSKNVCVIKNLTLEVKEGETLVILGKSGSGKTTVLKLINRLLDPTSGTIMVGGKDTLTLDPIVLRRSIGYAVQEIGLFPHMTVEENIAVVPKLLGWEEQKIKKRVEQLLEIMRLDPSEFKKRYPLKLSGGQRQRIGVARAIAADPPIILMDEPFGALDPITREQTQKEFLELESKIKKTIVFVTHDIFEAVRMGDRIALMDQGELVQIATPRSFVENPPTVFADEFLGQHRFQLSLLTKTITENIETGPKKKEESLPELTPNTTLIEALNAFKEAKAEVLPVYSGSSYQGEVKKEKLLDEIMELL
ncbi:ABC transporter ATP-binding protein [Candidatus Neptunochlamydia vexilliferae]|uniref:Osmoprotectant import ATP-binding protein OsmV n=1 Tax=Candidatus Neptunichlamydia vexilliferae TaxID=1651774 RepID=A0ABS0AYV4_9BACT|nr:ABC transporter ATP-binding protein [Candidatus Neptunochlamydia vexilliferae]MBF5059291.1 Osmoprotectant import ATP-binding protein OsmV [Candidatus Neptunochlamydia vexilliferae]